MKHDDILSDMRNQASSRRLRPTERFEVHIAAESLGELPKTTPSGPIDLTVEVTTAVGHLSPWFDADWWTDVISRWADEPITIHISPTPAALLHPVTLHHLETLHRVVPRWRIVGHAYLDDVVSPEAVARVARSSYHEVRFVDALRFRSQASDRGIAAPCVEELFAQIRREQASANTTRPILVRLPAPKANVSEAPPSKKGKHGASMRAT